MKSNRGNAGKYIYITPVVGVRLGQECHGSYRINKVTLIFTNKFLKSRKHLFAIKKWRKFITGTSALNASDVLAMTEVDGPAAVVQRLAHKRVREELFILSSSRLGHTTRTRRSILGIAGCQDSYGTDDILLGLSIDFATRSSKLHTSDYLRINKEWLSFPDKFFPFRRLLKVIRGAGDIQPAFRNTLRNMATLAGRSQNSIELADAFLWNMIALEQLLIGGDENNGHLALLKRRLQAFFGYCPLWEQGRFDQLIADIYKKRCELVHEGRRDAITIQDVIASDLILFNLIGSIVFNLKLFRNKGDIFDFAEKARARNLLGFAPRGKSWKWFFVNLRYEDKDLKEFWSI